MSISGKEYYNVVCQELCIIGGMMIHVDENCGTMDDVHRIMSVNMKKFPKAVWLVFPMRC